MCFYEVRLFHLLHRITVGYEQVATVLPCNLLIDKFLSLLCKFSFRLLQTINGSFIFINATCIYKNEACVYIIRAYVYSLYTIKNNLTVRPEKVNF